MMELGIVEAVSGGRATVRLVAEQRARQRPMPCPRGAGVQAGDRVLVSKVGGVYMVIGAYAEESAERG